MLPVLNTARLLLRPLAITDLFDFNEYCSVEGVGEMAGWSHHTSIDESRDILTRMVSTGTEYALVLKTTGKMIGTIGIKPSEDTHSPLKPLRGNELGYVLSKDYWGQGLMPEAVAAVVDMCFASLDAEALYLGIFEDNARSAGVASRLGFSFRGMNPIPESFPVGERQVGYYMLTKADWKRKKDS